MSEPVNVNNMNKEEFKKFLDSFDHVFSDCDGVIWSREPLPGSGEFFKLMKKHGKSIHYVSNNSLRTKENYEMKFKAAEIDDGYENLTIPSTAIVEYLKSKDFKKTAYCVTCSETMNVLESNGFKCKYGPDVGADQYTDFVEYLAQDEEIGAVVFDSDFKINLPKLYKASTYLKRPEVEFINGATDRVVPLQRGLMALGVGMFTDILVDYLNRQPIQLGKPGKLFGEFAMKRAGVTDPARVLFIGDMIEQDVALGKETGFKTLLVLTSHKKEDMIANTVIRPDYYADNLGSVVPLFSKL
ncbi:4-nitrophenylphosphatase-like [Hyposmocoma kahamanoa]|uniref:4-nitrophenylphosphatase-like n=1 Tax=Hyposmocoma kahamanoa TaxID=1477025 RepID=UPI000E6DA347|nr:4-nitrophenylphosphatase-like [Hyposmocoma kahamanoa]